MRRLAVLSVALLLPLLAACDMLGIDSPERAAAARDAEGRAVGAACRHAGRAIEDCYTLNKRIDKAAIFVGWRDMNDYMRENKIDTVAPVIMAQAPARIPADAKPEAAKSADAKPADGDQKPAKPKDGKDVKS